MNHSVKVTAGGQLPLPAEVLQSLGVKPGDRVDFVPTGDGAFQLRPHPGSPPDPAATRTGLSHLKGLFGSQQHAVDVEQTIFETVRRRTDPNRSELDP